MMAWPPYRTAAERARSEAAMAALVSGAADLAADPIPGDAEIELEIRVIESSSSFTSPEAIERIRKLRAMQFARRQPE